VTSTRTYVLDWSAERAGARYDARNRATRDVTTMARFVHTCSSAKSPSGGSPKPPGIKRGGDGHGLGLCWLRISHRRFGARRELVSDQGALGAGTLVSIDRDLSERWLLGQWVMA